MAKKSLIQKSEIDEVKKSHNCQANAKHRLKPGDLRLKVSESRSHTHYCAECAMKIIERDVARLQLLAQKLQGHT